MYVIQGSLQIHVATKCVMHPYLIVAAQAKLSVYV